VESEERLMIFCPPRFGKSLMASNYFPSWILGHHPDWEIIASSYNVGLPMGFSRKIRARIRDPIYRAMFAKTALDPESQSVEAWHTTGGGGYVAAGTGGGITGKGAHVLILDDLLKDDTEADSETIRESVWDWVGSTAYTRLSPGGGLLLIMTRWHDADPAGKFLTQEAELKKAGVPKEELENWEVVSYPAIADNDEYLLPDHRIVDFAVEGAKLLRKKGDPLHPDRFPLRSLLKKKRTLQPRHWSALYQQKPTPDEGLFIKKDYVRYYPMPMDFSGGGFVNILAGDLAISKHDTANFTVLGVGTLDWNGDLWMREVIRGRLDTFEIVEALVKLWKRWNCQLCGIEQGTIYQAIKPVLERHQRSENVILNFDEELKPVTDKIIRARPLQGWMQNGRVHYPSGQPWVETGIQELLRFPGGLNDDFVDMMAWMVRMAARMPLPRVPAKKKIKSWRDRLKALGRSERNYMAA
jgi:predicted phage terminase large subunit-like protein